MIENLDDLTLDQLKSRVEHLKLLKEAKDLKKSLNQSQNMESIDLNIKKAQLDKIQAEIKVTKKVTPTLESIKLISSLIIGIGGAIGAIGGFQFAKLEQREAEAAIRKANDQMQEMALANQKLKESQESLKVKNERVGSVLDDSMQTARQLHDDTSQLLFTLATLKSKVSKDVELKRLIDITEQKQQVLTDTIYAANRKKIDLLTGKALPPPEELINDIFGDSPEIRLNAFEILALYYRNDEKIIPLLVAKASKDRKNFNGIYNAFSALLIMPPEMLIKHKNIISPLLTVSDQIGPRTQRKATEIQKLILNK